MRKEPEIYSRHNINMRVEIPRKLSDFEAIKHNKHRKINFFSEIKDCFEYFEQPSPKNIEKQRFSEIHGSKITLRRVNEGTGFAVEINGVTQIVGKDRISIEKKTEIITRIWHISFPYKKKIEEKYKVDLSSAKSPLSFRKLP